MRHTHATLSARRALAVAAAGLTALGSALLSLSATAAPKMPAIAFGVEKCVPKVLAKFPGEVLQVVLKLEKGVPVWEVEVEAKDGRLYDIECSGRTGKIVETEERFASASAPAFAALAKISEADATKAVLAKHPGSIERVEYEIEADGSASYEFDIERADGTGIRVEVNAKSGKVGEARVELVEIGRMPK